MSTNSSNQSSRKQPQLPVQRASHQPRQGRGFALNQQQPFISYLGLIGVVALIGWAVWWIMKPNVLMPPQRDSGVFAYIGQRILLGELPYRDIWDHKPPLVFYLNALGLWLKPTIEGVMYLQFLFTSLAALFIYLTFKRLGSSLSGLLAVCFLLINVLYLNEYGNETEQWALPFQTIAAYLVLFRERLASVKTHLIVGLCAGMAFFLRQNLIGFWVAYGLVLLLTAVQGKASFGAVVKSIASLLVGTLLVTSIVFGYFAGKGAWGEFQDVAFRYNFAYISTTFSDRLLTISKGWEALHLSVVVVIAYLLLLVVWLRKRAQAIPKPSLLVLLIGLPLEVFLSAMSGRIANHYYLAWLPVCALLIGTALFWMEIQLASRVQPALRWGIVMTIVLGLSIKPYQYLTDELKKVAEYHQRFRHREVMAEAILQYTKPEEYFLEWGIPDGMNFLTNRKAPTRFIYQWALDTPGYTSPALVDEFVNQVTKNPPIIIMDSSLGEHLPPLDPGKRYEFYQNHPERIPLLPQNIVRFYQFLGDNYQLVGGNRIGFYMQKDKAKLLNSLPPSQ